VRSRPLLWRLVVRRLRRRVPGATHDALLGDLVEDYRKDRRARGRLAAEWRVWRDARSIARGYHSEQRGPTSVSSRLGDLIKDVAVAGRMVRRTPWYSVAMAGVVAVSVALGGTCFAIVDGVLFRPLPYPHAGELFGISGLRSGEQRATGHRAQTVSTREFHAWSKATPDLRLTATSSSSVILQDGAIRRALYIDRNFATIFGLRFAMGGVREEDFSVGPAGAVDASRPPQPMVITHRLWRELFNADPAILGRVIHPHSQMSASVQVVGVLAHDSLVPMQSGDGLADALLPHTFDLGDERYIVPFVRLRDAEYTKGAGTLANVIVAASDAAPTTDPRFSPVARRAREPFVSAALVPLDEYLTAKERPLFLLAFGLAACLLALGTANLIGLTSARAIQRHHELQLRRALGASRRQIFWQVFLEHVVLAAAGCLAGAALISPLVGLTLRLLPDNTNLVYEPTLHWRVAAFAVAVAAASAVCAAAVTTARTRVCSASPALGHGSHVAGSRTRRGPRLIVAAQTALAFILVLAGFLFAASVSRAWSNEPGFRVDRAATLLVMYRDVTGRQSTIDVANTLRTIPGVASAGSIYSPWLEGYPGESRFQAPATATPGAAAQDVSLGSGSFSALGVRLLDGRLPTDAELDAGAPVVAVSEALARAFWPGQNPIGQRLKRLRIDHEVVGVIGDARFESLDWPPTPALYTPPAASALGMRFILAFNDTTAPSLDYIVSVLAHRHPNVQVRSLTPVSTALADSIRTRRLAAAAATAFSVTATLLVTVGVLGLVAMSTARRTREIGVRMALGSTRTGVFSLVIGEQLASVAVGLILGAFVASGTVRFIRAHLYEVSPFDPAAWVVTGVTVLTIATLGAWFPARTASRIDPVRALRADG
jgi:putative ABC transport system permease protein